MKDIRQEICKAGEAAVEGYKKVSGLESEDTIPEVYLSCAMAMLLHSQLGVHARVECDYLLLATKDLGLKLAEQEAVNIERLRADIALYKSGHLVAIVEVKKFAESDKPNGLFDDLTKGGSRMLSNHIAVYGAFLVCETATQSLDTRRDLLRPGFGASLYFSTPRPSSSGGWMWCFGCARAE